jgi:hypothetical protein
VPLLSSSTTMRGNGCLGDARLKGAILESDLAYFEIATLEISRAKALAKLPGSELVIQIASLKVQRDALA